MKRPVTLVFCLLVAAAAQSADPLPDGATLRIGSDRFRVDELSLRMADLSPDGGHLVVVGRHHEPILFDTSTGRERRRLGQWLPHIAAVRCLPDGRVAVVASSSSQGGIWDPAKNELTPLKFGAVSDRVPVSFSADGRWLAYGGVQDLGRPMSATVFDMAAGERAFTVECLHNSPLNAELSPDGKTLFTWGRYRGDPRERRENSENHDHLIQVWDLETRKERSRFDTGGRSIQGVTVSADGKRLVTHHRGSGVKLWDTSTGKLVGELAGRSNLSGRFAFSPDGKRLAGSCWDGSVQIWDLENARPVSVTPGPAEVNPELRWLADGRLLAWGLQERSVLLWDALTGEDLAPNRGHVTAVWPLAFSADGRTLFSADQSGPLRSWDARTGRPLDEWVPEAPPDRPGSSRYHRDWIRGHAGRFIVWGSSGDGLSVFDRNTRQELYHFSSGGSGVFSADGDWFFPIPDGSSADRPEVPPLEIWNTETGRPVRLPGRRGAMFTAAVSADGSTLVGAVQIEDAEAQRRAALCIWDVPSREMVAEIERPPERSYAVAVSGDGRHLAAGSPTLGLTVWSIESDRPLRAFAIPENAYDCAPVFSPDGRTLAVAVRTSKRVRTGNVTRTEYSDSTVKILELASGRVRHEFRGHRGQVSSMAYRPDGGVLATGGFDTTILLWDVRPAGPPDLTLPDAWKLLAGTDAGKAAGAMGRLSAEPDEAVRFLGERLKPAEDVGIDPDRIREWIADLDGTSFKRRESAMARLLESGRAAEGHLREALSRDELGAEGRRRAEMILRKMERHELTPEQLRHVRAIEVLERLTRDSADARRLLKRLAGGDADAVLTKEAADAVARLAPG